jgi:nucleoside-diphosphate-sugar epimerase
MAASARRLLIAGCGDLGTRLSRRLEGWDIHGLRRDPSRLPAPIRPVAADLNRPSSLETVAGGWDAVVYTATPGEFTPEAYRATYVEGLRALAGRVESPRWIAVSSTAVYGQDAGEWVDESSATEPKRFNGEILLEAERIVGDLGGIVVRFSGIYGPGRDFLIRKLEKGGVTCRREPPIWTNRIHSEDCAATLEHLLTLEAPAPLYVASDRLPAPRWDVLSWLAERIGVAGPREVDDDGGQGKRITAARLFDSGLALQYPDYRVGYEELLECD